MEIRTVEAGGAAVAVREWAAPGGSGAMFAVAAEVLAAKGFTVAAPTRRGSADRRRGNLTRTG